MTPGQHYQEAERWLDKAESHLQTAHEEAWTDLHKLACTEAQIAAVHAALAQTDMPMASLGSTSSGYYAIEHTHTISNE